MKRKGDLGVRLVKILLTAVLLLLSAGLSGVKADEAPKITVLDNGIPKVLGNGALEFSVDIGKGYKNPYDPSEVSAKAFFKTPGGKQIVIPVFSYQDYAYAPGSGDLPVKKGNTPGWKARLLPEEKGEYRFFISLKTGGKTAKSPVYSYVSSATPEKGVVRNAHGSYLYLSSGEPFFCVGENVAWTEYGDSYEKFFDKLSRNGCNTVRVWMCSWNVALEWTQKTPGPDGYEGLGRYDQRNAWKLDRILELASERGIYVILVLGSYGELADKKMTWNEEAWEQNPYNAVNGGPCAGAADFWTDPLAREMYKRRLSYIVSRWGSSANILAFELWNETNSPIQWVKEMAGYIKKQDPYKHLVTTSVGSLDFKGFDENKLWALPEIDLVQVHLYGNGGEEDHDIIDHITYKVGQMRKTFRKPVLVGEYGIGGKEGDKAFDPKGVGVHIHDALWAGLFSGSAGGAMNWWWDEYVDKYDTIYAHFRNFSGFVNKLVLPRGSWQDADIRFVTGGDSSKKGMYGDAVLSPLEDWGNVDKREVVVNGDGSTSGARFNAFLHGIEKKDIRVCPVVSLDCPSDIDMVLRIGEVSTDAAINVYLDGKLLYHRVFPKKAENGTWDWKKRTYRQTWNLFQYEYNEDIVIRVPSGSHKIRFENTGSDWISIKKITLKGYLARSFLSYKVLGIKSGKQTVVWMHNGESGWFNNFKGIQPKPISGARIDLMDLGPGEYNVEWWDTWGKGLLRSEVVAVNGNSVSFAVPDLERDIVLLLVQK